MTYYPSLLIPLFFLITIISPVMPTQPAPVNPQQQQKELINSIINTLAGIGDFTSWARVLPLPPTINPFNTTFFVPNDDALSHLPTTPPLSFDPFIFPYHIVPQRLSFPDLLRYKINTRIPTLLPNNSIVVTSNSVSNFRIDDSRITHPDLYVTETVIVHGIGGILDYSVYGDGFSLTSDILPKSAVPAAPSRPPPAPQWSSRSPPPPPPQSTMTTTMKGFGRSEVCCLSTKLLTFLVPAFWFMLLIV